MPQYPNPYDFVPLENEQPERRPWDPDTEGIERWHPKRYSGRFSCVLHPETPLFIHGQGQQREQKRQFFRLGDQPTIAATSLKGAIRSIYEIVSDSCLSSLSEEYQVPRGHRRTYGRGMDEREFHELHPIIRPVQRVPQAYLPCTSLERVCPACRLFGMVEQAEEGKPLAGRVFFSDAVTTNSRFIAVRIPAAGGGPHPWHTPFYFFQERGKGQILGRKLYFHHRDYRETLRLYGEGGRPGLIEVEAQLGDFAFQVDFINLSEQELAYLAYSLVLEDNIRHHLGYGKPYGLGSARIRVQSLTLWHAPDISGNNRFLRWSSTAGQETPVESWAAKGKANWLNRPGAKPAYDAFTRILRWPGVDLYRYPDFTWFRRTEGSQYVTLAEYQRGIRQKQAPPTTAPSPISPTGRQHGWVEFFDGKKGWGFIRADSGERVFVHFSDIRGTGYRTLWPGDEVEFEMRLEPKGPKAYDVIVISSSRE